MLLKVSLFVWKLSNKRIPMKDNLFCREVALLGPTTCWGVCGKEKSINHVFFECDFLVEFDFVFCNGWKFVVCYLLMSLCIVCNLVVHIYLGRSFVITSKWFDRRIFELFGRSVILEFFSTIKCLRSIYLIVSNVFFR